MNSDLRVKSAVALCCLLSGFSLAAVPGDTLRFALPGWVELELVEVGGTAKIPLSYLYTGKDREKLTEVEFPKYWIGKFEVMQKQYEAVTGDNPSLVKGERLPVTNVRWIDAVEFCDRLNAACQGEIPPGYRFDLPTVAEWASAFVSGSEGSCAYAGSDDLDAVAWHGVGKENDGVTFDVVHMVGLKQPNGIKAYDMSGNVAEHVFLCGAKGDSIRIGGSVRWPERYCGLCSSVLVKRESCESDLGFRVALVPVTATDPNGRSSEMCTKGKILTLAGYPALARQYLTDASTIVGLPEMEKKRVQEALMVAEKATGHDVGDWDSLMTVLSERLTKAGYLARLPLEFWSSASGDGKTELRTMTKDFYRRHGIYGMMVTRDELPPEVKLFLGFSMRTKAQVVSCDFTGDGLMDLVVELVGSADQNGELFGFFERKPEGGYSLVGEPIRTVGMCPLPAEMGKSVVFLTLIKRTDDILTPGVIDCTDVSQQKCLRVAWPLARSFCLGELANEEIHDKVPFMGHRNAVRMRNIAEESYVRPMCWPWKD